MRKWPVSLNEKGQVLPIVLVALALGSLLVLPSLSFVSTNIKAGEVVKENEKGLYAAEAGIEHGLHRIKTEWAAWSQVDSTWALDDNLVENQMNVNVKGTATATVFGGQIVSKGPNPPNVHSDLLSVNTTVSWKPSPGSPGPYLYNFVVTLKNLGSSTTKIDVIWMGLQDGTYVNGSTNCTAGYAKNPDTISGDGSGALLLIWGNQGTPKQLFTVNGHASVNFNFQIWGPAPNADVPSGIFFYDAVMPNDADKGSVLGSNQYSYYTLTSTASTPSGNELETTITSHIMTVNALDSGGSIIGVSGIKILDWEISP